MLAVARGSHSCAAEIDLGTTTPRKKPGPENLGSGDETRELHKTRVFHQIFNAADGPEKSGFRACLTEIRPKPPSINPQTRKKSHNQNPGFARKTQVTHSPIPGLSRVSPRSRVFPGCLCCVLGTYPPPACLPELRAHATPNPVFSCAFCRALRTRALACAVCGVPF